MEQKEIEQRVREIVAEQLGKEIAEIKNESSFQDDLGADSLDQVELVMKLEEVFKEKINGEISEKDAEQLTTVGSVIKYIENDGKLA